MTDIYKQALDAARAELEALTAEQAELESRLETVKDRSLNLTKTVDDLAALVGDYEGEIGGLTKAICDLLATFAPKGLNPTAVRNGLRERNFPIDNYSNPMAVIHTTLKRLEEQGKLHSWEKDGKTFYRLVEHTAATITDNDIPF
jgi:chromosome segregation ATPase